MEEIISTEKLSKQYKDTLAVSEISLNVRRGEIYGFLGLNGAGKTTTIRMLLGMIKPSSGKAFINGEIIDSGNTKLWIKTGYLVEVPYSYPNLTVRENLEIIRRLRNLPDKTAIDEVISRLKLGAYANKMSKHLSLGNAQRLGLAKALIHNPEILILDEPSNGLDPAGIFEIREMLMNLAKQRGVTIFISSHILGEISRFATRIGIIHEGRLVQEIDSSQLDKLCLKRLLIKAREIKPLLNILLQSGYNARETKDGILEIKDERATTKPEEIAKIMVNSGYPPTLLQVEEEDLESYFLRIIKMNGGVK